MIKLCKLNNDFNRHITKTSFVFRIQRLITEKIFRNLTLSHVVIFS